MHNKFLLILIFSFLSMSLQAENFQYNDNSNYQISEIQYQKKNKTYTSYKYYKTKQQLRSENYDSLYLMIASPSLKANGAFGGHTYVVLSTGDKFEEATAISFSAVHETLNLLEGFEIVQLITSGIPGYVDILPFSLIAERNTISQERTVFYYKLDIDKEGINLIIDRLYELLEGKLLFQYITKNCADFAMKLLNAAPNINLSKETPAVLIPSYLPVIMERNKLVLERGSFSPPIARLNNETLNISKELIIDKKDFYTKNLRETTFRDNSEKYIPQKDLYDYGTNLDSYMSQVSLGIEKDNPTLGLSFFSSRRYEQRQGPTQSIQVNILEMNFLYADKVKIDSFNLFEFSYYPKINYGFDFTKKIRIFGERDFNDKLQPSIRGGLGISLGNTNILFNLTSDLDIPLTHLGIDLSLNSELILYNKIGYFIIKGNLPYYQINSNKEFSLESKVGISLFDRLNIENSYNWIDKYFKTTIIWNFNPFYFG